MALPLTIGVNGQTAGTIRPVSTNALRYNTNKGVWNQYIEKFDASLMKAGENEMTFTVPAGDVTTGVVWDYLRLELNDGSKAYPIRPTTSQRPDYADSRIGRNSYQMVLHRPVETTRNFRNWEPAWPSSTHDAQETTLMRPLSEGSGVSSCP